jgi:type VI secretion system protein ImpM
MPSVFLFGKLPAHGDFVARGLTTAEQERWDRWASAGLEAARERLGDGFEAAHDAALPWRFVAADGEGWTAGAVTCSVDAAGRRFVAVLGVDGLTPQHAAALGLPVAAAAEAGLYRALSTSGSADTVVAEFQAVIGAPEEGEATVAEALGAAPAVEGLWWTTKVSGGVSVLRGREPPTELWLEALHPDPSQEDSV